ncbi:FAD-dependent monooxygenase [Gordonia sp. i37]|uniref:FAD-dependent monooxygenase n=1 Tax=Gordonia sp. i37 TaxID=1961707 RepID=UPI001C0BDD21|nr:FAD-dependent monooxygenase [Gordonia sp. i37]
MQNGPQHTGTGDLRVAVIGGGIGGMAAAGALLARGLDVEVYEQAPKLAEVGAGVLITPNSLRFLERIGLGPALAEVGARISDGSTYYRADGSVVAPILTSDSQGWNGMYGMHRADLLDALVESFPAQRIHADYRCVGFTQDESGAHVEFANGERAHADVVIGADGINSTLQRYVVEPSTPVNSGSIAYRGLIPAQRLPEWKQAASQLWMGDRKHFLVYPVRRGELINYVAFVPSTRELAESWSAPGDPDELRRSFEGWDPVVTGLLERVETTHWWGLYDREPLTEWTSGRLALLGDAAHPMLPHLGQGANQSIEDAAALGVFLDGCGPAHADIVDALAGYAQVRRPRTGEVQAGARANGRRYDSEYPDLTTRDSEIVDSVTFRRWLYDFDAEAVAAAARERLQSSGIGS